MQGSFNILDAAVIAVILFFAVMAYRKGFIMACLGFLPTIAGVFCAYRFYPLLSKTLRQMAFFGSLKERIYNGFDLSSLVPPETLSEQVKAIEGFGIPDFLKSSLIENNNSLIYSALEAGDFREYISGFLANMVINIISALAIFIVVAIVLKLIISMLDIAFKLPVLNFINRVCGFAVGAAQGVLTVWMLGLAVTFFYSSPAFSKITSLLENSVVALWFYNNNLLLSVVLKIFS